MTPRQIQIELRERNITQHQIAKELGVTDGTLSQTIRRRSVSRRIMQTIAEKIDRDIKEVFPEYFDLPPVEEKDALTTV